MEFAVTMGMDAFRICIGHKPRNHSLEDIIRWMGAMSAASFYPVVSEPSSARPKPL